MKKLLPKTVSNPQGFTLVELLVVVSIIAILSVVGITVFTSTQKGARDARRKSDIDAIAKALEIHYNDTTSPCSATAAMPYCASANSSTFYAGGTYPANPTPGGTDYSVNIPAARTSYTVCALLENNNGNSSTSGDGTTFTSATGAAATHYCRKNQQ